MNAKMWEELETEFHMPGSEGWGEFATRAMRRVERRHLPERVAEVLEKAIKTNWPDNALAPAECCRNIATIAKALRTGDLSEIEKWVKK